MDLSEMRERLTRKLGLSESDFETVLLDAELNRVWRFAIPNRIDAAAIRGFVSLATVAGTDTYDIDVAFSATPILALEGPAFYGTDELTVYSDPALFWSDWNPGDTTQGTPNSLLWQARRITLRPIPAAIYTVRVHAARYRDALTASGVADEQEAQAVVDGAVARMAHEIGEDDVAARYEALFERDVAELTPRYRANAAALPRVVMDF